jgi:glycosyltransferase involved in cell wall biosynthesis
MRVLHIIPNLKKGGAERLCLDIIKYLSKAEGVEVRLAVLEDVNEYITEYPQIKTCLLMDFVKPSITSSWGISLNNYRNLLNEFKPDIIHTHLFEADFLAHYSIDHKIKYVTHCHDNIHQLSNFKIKDIISKKRITELYEKKYIIRRYKECNNHFLAISINTKEYLKNVLPAALKKNIVLFPNAVDTSRFTNELNSDIKRPLKLVNVGSFVPKKNQRFLIDVMRELNKKNIKAELTLVGDGILKDKTIAYAKEQKCLDQIQFPGKIDRIESILNESHIYLHSAIYEPFGLVLLEAMAAGLPVICLDGGGNRDLIRNGDNGYIIGKRDPKLMADKIELLIKDASLRMKISENAYEFSKQFDIKLYVDKLLALYNSILKLE